MRSIRLDTGHARLHEARCVTLREPAPESRQQMGDGLILHSTLQTATIGHMCPKRSVNLLDKIVIWGRIYEAKH